MIAKKRRKMNIIIIFKEYTVYDRKIYSFLEGIGIELLFCAVNNYDLSNDEIDKINLIDFGRLKKINPAIINGDIDNYIDRVFNKVVGNQSLDPFFRFYNGIINPDKKIKIYFRKFVANEFLSNVSLIHWLEQSEYCNYTIVSMLDINRMGKEYWKFSKLKVYHFPIIKKQKIIIIKKFIIELIKFLINYPGLKKKVIQKQKKDDGLNLKMFKVIFFPHKSVFYGNLFIKDHFYSKDQSSSFHPRNMIHLEHDNIDIDKAKKRYLEYFGFEPFHMHLDSLTKNHKERIYFELLQCIDLELIRSIIKSKISFTTILRMTSLYYSYLYFYNAIREFDNVKIALVGYDVLFPIPLSLALESNGIKTIAVQERFIQPFQNNYSYVIDTQFTVSNYISSLLQSKEGNFAVSECIPIGFIRSDKLVRPKTKNNKKSKRKRILIFDYPVQNIFNNQISEPVINWENDHFFRKEIIKIAQDFNDYDFIIRGKNIEWMNIEYFHDILYEWNNTSNIIIDTNYSEFYRAYELCNNINLIIAKHTSIADECISKGYDVIIFEYGINYSCFIKDWYPKIPGINFCHSYEELRDYMNFFHKNGYITTERQKTEIINTLFDGLSDGNVRTRVSQYLDEIICD